MGIDRVEIDRVGIDRVGIDRVGIDSGGNCEYTLENILYVSFIVYYAEKRKINFIKTILRLISTKHLLNVKTRK